jgi:hypothetical protein
MDLDLYQRTANSLRRLRWRDQQPVETITERPDQPLPDVDKLNAKIPKKQWELGLDGQPRPPWQLEFVVYLMNPETADLWTFINSTTGARIGAAA